jgi:hypothetical protein
VKDPQYALKLTWNVSPNHKLAFSWFGDERKRSAQSFVNGPSAVASPYTDERSPYSLSLQWNATWSPRFFTEAALGRMSADTKISIVNPAARSSWTYWYAYTGYGVIPTGPPSSYDPATSAIDLASWRPNLGANAWGDDLTNVSDQLRLKATWLFDAAGRHELSFGLQAARGKVDRTNSMNGPPTVDMHPELTNTMTGDTFPNPFFGVASYPGALNFWFWDPDASAYRFQAFSYTNGMVSSVTQDTASYWVQDNWNLTDAFMLKLGLRLERVRMNTGAHRLNAPGLLDPRGGPYGQYFTGAPTGIYFDDQWAPRLGFTWDVARNGKSKLFGSYGVYCERPTLTSAMWYADNTIQHFEYFADAVLTQPVGPCSVIGLYQPRAVGGPRGGTIKGAFTEEWLLGFQYEVRPDLSLGARAIYRDLGRAFEDLQLNGGMTPVLTNPDQWTGVWFPDYLGRPGFRWRYPKPVRRYAALELSADKRFSDRWMLQASYTLSRLEGNYEGLWMNDTGNSYPDNVTLQFDLPEDVYNGFGPLPNDRTHVLKVFGGYYFEGVPLELSGRFTLMSGIPISKHGREPLWGTMSTFVAPRGSAGRTPTVWSLDLGVQYTFKVGKTDLALRVDIFNVTNQQITTQVDQTYNYVSNEDVRTNPNFGKEISHQQGRRVRLAIRWTF